MSKNPFNLKYSITTTALCVTLFGACKPTVSPPLSPEQALQAFDLVPGYKIELVASEPMVQEPVVIQFDEDGRLWVVEMRGFMPNIEGEGEDQPIGRVSILLDQDHDGEMDRIVIFADSLVLPRALAVVEGGALVAEEQALWFIQDLDGDLQADKRILIDANYGIKGVVEHAPNGLWRGMDNWYYNAKADFRYKKVGDEWIKDSTEFRGQWGMSHDNYGRLYYNYNWSQLHIDLVPPNYISANPNHQPSSGIDHSVSMDRQIFPVRTNPAINRGYIPGALDEQGKLVEFTSACAPYIYRGQLFNDTVVGDAFVCEPTGNLIKHNHITQSGLFPSATNAYPNREFLASTDERFRPVGITSGPDGALYIADLYRGIIQHGLYMSDYLKQVTLERGLDQGINFGRIWRIVPETAGSNKKQLALSEMSTSDLVDYLAHDNGWYRDVAQRLLVERKDPASIELLIKKVKEHANSWTRLQALWTLEGIGYQEAEPYVEALHDSGPQVRAAALRILEPIIGNNSTLVDLEQLITGALNSEVLALQASLSARVMETSAKSQLLLTILDKYQDKQIFRDAVLSSIRGEEFHYLVELANQSHQSAEREITLELLAAAVAKNHDTDQMTSLLGLLDDPQDWRQKAIITGLSYTHLSEPVDLPSAPSLFTESHSAELAHKIEQVSQLYHWPGKTSDAPLVTTDSISEVDPKIMAQGRNLYLSVCASCHGNDGQGVPRFAPPLVNSEWVLGNESILTRILLHGMEGPVEVNGKVYQSGDIMGVMPSFNSTPAGDLAAIMSYIRQEWGHRANPVEASTVGRMRVMTQGKVTPWTAEELQNLKTSNTE